MKLEDLIARLEQAEKKLYQDFCRRAAQEEIDRKALGRELQEFFSEVLQRLQEKPVAGPLVGQFWKRFSGGKKKKKKKKPPQKIDLRDLATRLPYPLGYKLREFVLEQEKFEKGYGSSNFPYLLASLNGLALRFLAVVGIAEYVQRLKAPDAKLNQVIVEGLRLPADGTWKSILDGLLGAFGQDTRLQLLPAIALHLNERRPFPGVKKGLSAQVILQELVRFRNELLHGTRRFGPKEVQEISEKVKVLYQSLSFLSDYRLVVNRPWGYYDCTGAVPSLVEEEFPYEEEEEEGEGEEKEQREGEEKEQGGLLLVARKGSFLPLPLSPLLYFVAAQEQEGIHLDEVFFVNSHHEEQVEFISYRYLRHQDHRHLGIPYPLFQEFLRRIPVSALPPQVLLDFRGLAEFHEANFVGRSEVLQSIVQFMEERPRAYGVIKALAGMGKTALLAQLYQHFAQEDSPSSLYTVWHFCGPVDGRDNPVVFLRSVLAQIDSFFGGMRKHYPTSLELLRRQLEQRLQEVGTSLQKKGQRLVLVVDALDEGIGPLLGSLSIPSILPPPSSLPPAISVLISFRVDESGSNERVMRHLPLGPGQMKVIAGCDPLGGLQLEEVRQMMILAAGGAALPQDTLQAIWQGATRREDLSEGKADPFFLRFVADGIREGSVDPDRPESVPESLTALFDRLWNNLPTEHDYFLQRLLGMLAVMPDLGSDEIFAEIFHQQQPHFSSQENGLRLSPDDVAERRAAINKLLVFSGDRYRLFHSRFGDYVCQRFRPQDEASHLQLPLLEYCLSRTIDQKQYALRHQIHHAVLLAQHEGLPPHLQEEYGELLWELLWDDAFFERKLATFQRADLILEDFQKSFPVFLPQETDNPEKTGRLLARTLHLTVRCNHLLNRCQQCIRQRIARFAQEGQTEQVIYLALDSGTAYRRLWSLLLAAAWMRRSGHDPERLFQTLPEIGRPRLRPGDRPLLLRLLRQAKAPPAIEETLLSWIPKEAEG